MNKRELEKLFKFWIPKLGLSHWRIRPTIEEFKPVHNAAQCQRTTYYNEAVIRFQHWLLDRNPPPVTAWKNGDTITDLEIEEVVVHELLHCTFAPIARSTVISRNLLKRKEYEMLDDSRDNAEETVIEDLATNLVRSFGVHSEKS